MKRRPSAAFAIALAFAVTTSISAGGPANQVFVTNANDSGPGSFRDAIAQASADPAIRRVQVRGGNLIINLLATVEFSGSQDLTIDGHGAILDGLTLAPVGPIFLASGGGSLAIADLTVRNSPAEGITVQVPGAATGTIHVTLNKVDIIDNAGHGVLVNDQVDPVVVDPNPPNPNGSDASLDVSVKHSSFIRNGYSVSDRDGLRVNEGGAGNLIFTIDHSVAEDNAADGIEIDERGDGDVLVDMAHTHVTGNGIFDPADLDDGFDIDEYNGGSIIGQIVHTSANSNFEEGFDFNENDAGDLRVDMDHVQANGNGEEGIDYEEDDDFAGGGDLVTTMRHVTANGNGVNDDGDAGLKIREKGAGDLDATLDGIEASNNVIGGISVREDDLGSLVSSVDKTESLGNGGRGIDFDENGDGDLTATVTHSESLGNGDVDIRADEASTGTGVLWVSKFEYVTSGGNVAPTPVP